MIYGTIIGDIVGSVYEWHNHKQKDFEFFTKEKRFTDDSVSTIAVANSIKKFKESDVLDITDLSNLTAKELKDIGRQHIDCGWGGNFKKWILEDDIIPYKSYGNGSAMRISGCAWYASDLYEVKQLVYAVTEISHNHPDSVVMSTALAESIFFASKGYCKEFISVYLKKTYDIDCKIHKTIGFSSKARVTVPQAIGAFMTSQNFEDCIRTAVSIGGDSDTIAAMAGSLAEAYYGIPKWMQKKARSYLTSDLQAIADEIDPL